MRKLSILSIVLSAIFLLIHIVFDFKNHMSVLMVNILIAIFEFVLLLAGFYLLDQKRNQQLKKVTLFTLTHHITLSNEFRTFVI